MVEPLVKELIEAGVHFGHQKSRWNPKMKRFIFGDKAGVYIVDVEKTAKGLQEAKEFLRRVVAQGGAVLFVGTKKQAQPIIQEQATRCGQYYVNLRWLGGLLTNFQTIQKSIQRLKLLQGWREDGTFDQLSKKEVSRLEKELVKLEKNLIGIAGMGRLPQAVYVVDVRHEETAVREANRLGIPVVGLVDTNSDPDPVSYVIPGNDDSIRSIRLVTSTLAEVILEARSAYLAGLEATAREAAEKRAMEIKVAAEETGQGAASTGEGGPVVGEIEKIIPGAALKAVEKEGPALKKRKAAKTKTAPKTGNPEAPPV